MNWRYKLKNTCNQMKGLSHSHCEAKPKQSHKITNHKMTMLSYILLLIFCFSCSIILSGCSGDSSTSTESAIIGYENSDGNVKLAKLEGSEIIVSNAPADQQNPHVIYLPDKNLWFSVYEDWSSLTTGADIKGRFIKADGALCGGELTITNASGNQTAPWAAYRDKDLLASPTGNDTILVVWQDTRGAANSGYVYYSTITSFPDSNCAYTPPAPSGGTPIGFNSIHRWDMVTTITPITATQIIGIGDGTNAQFNAFLGPSGNIVPTSVTIYDPSINPPLQPQEAVDDGLGHFIPGSVGTATGVIDYDTGAITVTFGTGPLAGTMITATYTYNLISYSFNEVSVNDSLLSRKLPKISYDPVRDRFGIVWNESRDTLNRVSDVCFRLAVFDWEIGDTSSPGYVMLDGATFAPLPTAIGVNGADIIRNAQVRTNRLLSDTHLALTETYTYEFFTDPNNITASIDKTSPEDFIVWEGVRRKGVDTCTCKDNNDNEYCDSGDTITSSFESSFFEEDENGTGLPHIYGLFDKEIAQTVIKSTT